MAGALHPRRPDGEGRWCSPHAGLGHLLLHTTPESLSETLPFRHPRAGLVITADARLDNRADLMGALDPPPGPMPDSRLILEAYMKWGTRCPEHLRGDFAFAVLDEKKRGLFCARDHMGCRPFFYHDTPDLFAFASSFGGVAALDAVPRDLDKEWLRGYALSLITCNKGTVYRGIRRLPPAHSLWVGPDHRTMRCYWKPDPHKRLPPASEREYVEAYREKLFQAVGRRLRSAFPVAAELSGGLDSSTVTCVARSLLLREGKGLVCAAAHALPEGMEDPPLADERRWIGQVLDFAGIEACEYVTGEETPGLNALIREELGIQQAPPLAIYSLFSHPLYRKVAGRGARILLSGIGGDEMVTSNAFGYLLEELCRKKEWSRLRRELGARYPSRLKALLKYLVRRSGTRLPMELGIRRRIRERVAGSPVNMEYFGERNVREHIARYFLWDIPGGLTLRERQILELTHPSLTARVEQSAVAARAHGLEYANPLLDTDLLEFYLALPSAMKFREGAGRFVHRESVRGLIPESIRLRNDVIGATLPEIRMIMRKDLQSTRDLVNSIAEKADSPLHRCWTPKALEALGARLGQGKIQPLGMIWRFRMLHRFLRGQAGAGEAFPSPK